MQNIQSFKMPENIDISVHVLFQTFASMTIYFEKKYFFVGEDLRV